MATRWTARVTGILSGSTVLYKLFFRLYWFPPTGTSAHLAWIPLWSGFYYTINVTSSL